MIEKLKHKIEGFNCLIVPTDAQGKNTEKMRNLGFELIEMDLGFVQLCTRQKDLNMRWVCYTDREEIVDVVQNGEIKWGFE